MTEERSGQVTFQGNPLTLVGPEIKVGDRAPAFLLVNTDLQPVTLDDSRGRVRLITTVPSLDTPVCDAMTRRFNEDAAELPDDVVVATVSMDLPFAQKRWCGNAGIEKIQTLSDYREHAFARDYGMLIGELQLLARGVFVIDREGVVAYRELVAEVTEEPDYGAALDAVRKLL